jgi:hypothetical protein
MKCYGLQSHYKHGDFKERSNWDSNPRHPHHIRLTEHWQPMKRRLLLRHLQSNSKECDKIVYYKETAECRLGALVRTVR